MDTSWLSQQAQQLHAVFQNAFFAMLVAFLLLSVAMEFLRIPLGNSPAFTALVGRAFIATLLLVALPEIMNIVADTTDSIAQEIGGLNSFSLVMTSLGAKLKTLSFSWTSIRDTITILISFLSFFALYVTIYFANAAFIYCWVLIYVFSPLVFALYIFPQTAGATAGLFRTILEVSLWKVCWAVMATLLWSTALSNINQPDANINWLTSIVLNLMLMISVLMTPKVVHALLSGGISDLASSAQGAVMAAASLTPATALGKVKSGVMLPAKAAAGFAKIQAAKATSKAWKGIKDSPSAQAFMRKPRKPQMKETEPKRKNPLVR